MTRRRRFQEACDSMEEAGRSTDGARASFPPPERRQPAATRILAGTIVASLAVLLAIAGGSLADHDQEGFTLPVLGAEEGDRFGSALSIDGDRALVGAENKDVKGEQDAGAVYEYGWTGSGWRLERELTLPVPDRGDRFGSGISLDGDTALIGADSSSVEGHMTGAAYVFQWDGLSWTLEQEITLGAEAKDDEAFGEAVLLDGDTAFISASREEVDGENNAGTVYEFAWDGTTWQRENRIQPPSSEGGLFGSGLALHGDTLLVGETQVVVDGKPSAGAVHAFTWDASQEEWTKEDQIDRGTDAKSSAYFGSALAVHEDRLLVGAAQKDVGGAAYTYNWEQGMAGTEGWVVEDEVSGSTTEVGDRFGKSVALNGYGVLVGASGREADGEDGAGAVYMFEDTCSPDGDCIWDQRDYIHLGIDTDRLNARFGSAVDLDQDTAVVGASRADVNSQELGAAHVYTVQDGAWMRTASLSPRDAEGDAWFGSTVALDGDTLIVGAPGEDGAESNSGAAYVLERTPTGSWAQQAKLTGDGGSWSFFGGAIALDGDLALVAASTEDVTGDGDWDGAVYAFHRDGGDWTREAKLTVDISDGNQQFGSALALDGETALVSSEAETVHAFTRTGSAGSGAWDQRATLELGTSQEPYPQDGDDYGSALALDGNQALVGAKSRDSGGEPSAGEAFVFLAEDPETWNLVTTLRADNPQEGAKFGGQVALEEGIALVGAYGRDDGRGAAYAFLDTAQGWELQHDLTTPSSAVDDQLGVSLALDGANSIIGAEHEDTTDAHEGAAYLQTLNVLQSSFTYDPTTDVTTSDEVAFSDESAGPYTSTTWDFGDGTTSNEANPTHRFDAADTYDVALAIEDAAGHTDASHQIIDVTGLLLVGIDATNGPVTEGSTLDVSFTVENTDSTSDTQTVTLAVDGDVQDQMELTLAAGEQATKTLSWTTEAGDAGDHAIELASEDGTATDAVTVEDPTSESNDGTSPSSDGGSDTGSSSGDTTGDTDDGSSSDAPDGPTDDPSLAQGSLQLASSVPEDAGEIGVEITELTDVDEATLVVENEATLAGVERTVTAPGVVTVAAADLGGLSGGQAIQATLYADADLTDELDTEAVTVDAVKELEAASDGDSGLVVHVPEETVPGEPVTLAVEPDDARQLESVEWELGEGVTKSGESVEHAFDEPGEHEVTVIAEDENGEIETQSHVVQVRDDGTAWLWLGLLAVGLAAAGGGAVWYRNRQPEPAGAPAATVGGRTCPTCDASLTAGVTFCSECGTNVPPPQETLEATEEDASPGERDLAEDTDTEGSTSEDPEVDAEDADAGDTDDDEDPTGDDPEPEAPDAGDAAATVTAAGSAQQTDEPAPSEEHPTCPACGVVASAGAAFCTECGESLEDPGGEASDADADAQPRCEGCGAEVGPDANFCSGCGAQL